MLSPVGCRLHGSILKLLIIFLVVYCYADGCISVRIYYFIITLEVLDIGTKELQINEEIKAKEKQDNKDG